MVKKIIFLIPLSFYWYMSLCTELHYDGVYNPRVSIISSIYKGDFFIESFMADIIRQTIFNQCELLLINANSPGNEEFIIFEYLHKYPNIRYIKLDYDPGLYDVWNYGISIARAQYITNANIDDRLAYDCYEKHTQILDDRLDIDLVYSDHYTVTTPNISFETVAASNDVPWNYFEFSKKTMSECLPNNHPMWRKMLHQKYGYFNPKFKSAGDWEMWLRAVEGGAEFLKLNIPLAVFYWNEKSGLSHTPSHQIEIEEIKRRYGHIWSS